MRLVPPRSRPSDEISGPMIAEATVAVLLKSALTTGGSAWTVSLFEGDWRTAIICLPALVLCGVLTWHHSRRLRGKRAEGPP